MPGLLNIGPQELSQLQKMLQRRDIGYILIIFPEFISNYNKMKQICGPLQIFVSQFDPSSFLSCAGLLHAKAVQTRCLSQQIPLVKDKD